MLNLILSWANKYLIYLVLAGFIISGLAGYRLAVLQQKAAQADAYEELLQVIQKNDELSRGVVEKYQQQLESKSNAYNKLTQELKHVKISSSKCDITHDGVRLWNNSTMGEATSQLPKDSAGTSEGTTSTSSLTIEDLMANKLKNDEICHGLREQIKSIIKWDKEVWNGSNSSGNKN